MSFNWDTEIRDELGYDSDNTGDWHCNAAVPALQELTPTFIQGHWADAKNKVFVGTTPNEYTYDSHGTPITGDITEELVPHDLDVTKSQSLIIYLQAMTIRQLDQFGRYVKRLVGI